MAGSDREEHDDIDEIFDDDEYYALQMAEINGMESNNGISSNNNNNNNNNNSSLNINRSVNNNNNNNANININNNNARDVYNYQRLIDPLPEKTQPPGFVASRVQSEDFVRSLDSIAITQHFVEQFDVEYGTSHPTFYLGPFRKALQNAKEKNQLVLVYLHTPTSESSVFCMASLTDLRLADYIDTNFVFWVGYLENMNTHLGQIVGTMQSPLMAVVGIDNNGNTNVVEFLHGVIGVDELMSRLMSAQENYGEIQNAMTSQQRAVEQMLQQDRILKQEQEEAYRNSLALDKKRIEEEEAQREQERIRSNYRQMELEYKRNNFPPEPTDPKNSTQVVLRFPDGSRLQRRFARDEKIQTLYDFVELNNQDIAENHREFTLITSFPKKILSDKNATLQGENLVPQAMIHIQL